MSIDQAKFLATKKKLLKSFWITTNFSINRKGWRQVRYRLVRPIVKRIYWRYQRLNPESPWVVPMIVEALKSLLEPHMIGFEFGSGRSTLFYARYLKKIYAVEHDEQWHAQVQQMIDNQQFNHIELSLVKAERDFTYPYISSEDHIDLSVEKYPVKDNEFTTYSNSILRLEDESLDFVSVDGRARVTCALNAIPKLKEGGLLMLDNSERKRYREVHEQLKGWPSMTGTTGVTDTTLWLKPKSS